MGSYGIYARVGKHQKSNERAQRTREIFDTNQRASNYHTDTVSMLYCVSYMHSEIQGTRSTTFPCQIKLFVVDDTHGVVILLMLDTRHRKLKGS